MFIFVHHRISLQYTYIKYKQISVPYQLGNQPNLVFHSVINSTSVFKENCKKLSE